ncbi:MAG: hypothetical protein KKH93_02740 [Candidatus Omnitrophica bacterium]|nr:hypothetical protein [Candidatus Omnitrophota bacterium]MBU2044191.1 hypothetical protein [Candidatus Omnitrophota bacterium]MBU2251329.1 hypothetical protein [Candidatus Omnitrophota bacterium]MBU2265475.1 hypothetical protein [Candidatus Omnitrophota bacterium]
MNLTKIIPVVLLVFMLGIGGIAWTFYSQNQELSKANQQLKSENAGLLQDNQQLKDQYNGERDKRSGLEEKLSVVSQDLTRLEDERQSLKSKLNEVTQERDLLVEKLSKSPQTQVSVSEPTSFSSSTSTSVGISEDHWADFVKKKAALEAKVDFLNKELFDAKSKMTQLDKDNKELSIKIDQLNKTKEQLDEELKFKERTLRVLSMDLVSEREERSSAVTELRKLRNENVSLKREIILANNEKLKLQDNLKSTMEKKDNLEGRISDAENVLKEKSMAFEDLQGRLEEAIVGGKRIVASESASVQLPPIIVKPETPGLRGLRGEVIAVNKEEKFVVVDIGEASGIRPGNLLKVMRGDREVATLEVIETRREISAADVREVAGGMMIQEGDIVISR